MKKIITLCLVVITQIMFSQEKTIESNSNSFGYESGLYSDFSAFKNKTPNEKAELAIKIGSDEIAHRFSYKDSGKKVKKVYAISYEGNLYIRIKSLMKDFDTESKGQSFDGGDYYLKVQKVGEFMFMEDYFTSNMAGLGGGLIGSAAARRVKGIIYDSGNEKFRLFKNYKRFIEFVEERYPDKKDMLKESKDVKDFEELPEIKTVLIKL